MYIDSFVIECIISKLKIEYGGCHAPHNDTPLYGRRAYWRVYLEDGTYVAKITTPVKTLNPKPKTLNKLLRAELRNRLGEIGYRMDIDNYGCMRVVESDPYSLKRLLELVDGKYMDIHFKQLYRARMAA